MATRAATMAPPFPYRPGSKFEIRAHTPPRPYGPNYETKDPVRRPVHGLMDDSGHHLVDHMGFVISNPPLDGPAPASTKPQPPRTLTIVKALSRKSKEKGGGGPVVVTCHLGADQSTLYVAKIFDGFEYALADEPGKYGCDCMYRADMHYSREAAAYASIPARFQGDIVPRYFGSWTFPLPTGVPARHRWVRMILIEFVQGECMLDTMLRALGTSRGNPDLDRWWREHSPTVDYRLLPPEQERLDILARIIEADTLIWWYGGVDHGDVAPRNVIISRSGPPNNNTVSRVTLIDFNIAYVLRHCERGRRTIRDLGLGEGLPQSPIERYWASGTLAYGGKYNEWIPESWAVADDDYEVTHFLAAQWLVRRWRASPRFRPLSEDFLNCPSHKWAEEPYRKLIEELKSFLKEGRKASSQVGNLGANGSKQA